MYVGRYKEKTDLYTKNTFHVQPYKFLALAFDVKVMVLEQLSARQSKTKNG